MEEIEYLYDIGVVNYTTLVTFKEILRVDQQHSIDYMKSMGEGWLQPALLPQCTSDWRISLSPTAD
jgi:hypothetical protein